MWTAVVKCTWIIPNVDNLLFSVFVMMIFLSFSGYQKVEQ